MYPLHAPPAEKDFAARSCCGASSILPKFRPLAPLVAGVIPCCFSLMLEAHAGVIYWGSPGFIQNADSRDREWNGDFELFLGAFRTGFVPTMENRDTWMENWVELGVASFDSSESRFAGVVDVSKTLPQGTAEQVYFWARNGKDLTKGPEWLLVTRPEWKWPGASSATSPALTWTTDSSASIVVGTIGVRGRHMVTDGLAPVPVGQAEWLAKFFPDCEESRNPDADPDGDGICNRMEYFLGSDPNDASSRICPEIRASGSGTLLTLQRNPYATTKFSVETSNNLKTWSGESGETLVDRPDLIEVRLEQEPGKSGFFRFKLEGGGQ